MEKFQKIRYLNIVRRGIDDEILNYVNQMLLVSNIPASLLALALLLSVDKNFNLVRNL